jgi:DNA-binding MarR family transcriptional regulator
MARRIGDELKMQRVEAPEQEAFLNVWRTQDQLLADLSALLKTYGISVTQYNVLRILRGAGEGGLSCHDISGRMVARLPDITRLLDRLERNELVSRSRSDNDRRVVITTITEVGRYLLDRLDTPVLDTHRRQFRNLTGAEVKQLNRLLTKVRESGGRKTEAKPDDQTEKI